MATVLDKQLKRQVTVGGADYIVAVDADGLRLTGKGRRKPEVELRWSDLLNGDAALAVALNASLTTRPAPARAAPESPPDPPARPAPEPPPRPAAKPAAKKRSRSPS